jgi:hypothetical protein
MSSIHGWAGASAHREAVSGARAGRDGLAWAKGAEGEVLVGRALESAPGVLVLHDRAVPGSTANIDHIAITPSGILVVDAKHYAGVPHLVRIGDGSILRLRVGETDRTDLVAAVRRQLGIVAEALGDPSVPARAVLCFVGVDAPAGRGFVIDDVGVTSPDGLRELAALPGPLAPDRIAAVHALLRERLAAA